MLWAMSFSDETKSQEQTRPLGKTSGFACDSARLVAVSSNFGIGRCWGFRKCFSLSNFV